MQCVLTGQAGGASGPASRRGLSPGRLDAGASRPVCGGPAGAPGLRARTWPAALVSPAGLAESAAPRSRRAGAARPLLSARPVGRGRSRAPSVGKRKQRERDVRRGPAVSSRRQECEEEGWAGSGRREGRPRGPRQPRGGGAAARAPGVPAEGLQALAPASVSRFDMTGATFGKSHGTATHRGGDSGEASPQMRKLRHRVERLAQGHTAGR